MFFSLRLRSKKEENRARKSGKWSIDRAFCPGASEKVRETFTENGLDNVKDIDSRTPEEPNYYDEEETKMTRIVGVALERDEMGLGITLRSGTPNQTGYKPLVITKIKKNGPAARDGTIKVGDRLLGIDGQRLTGLTLSEAERLLVAPNGGRPVWLSVEYDISVMTALRAAGPLLVEVEPPSGNKDLGLTLMDSLSGVIVSSVRTASIAERCGAILPGDQILSVNEYRIENSKITASKVMQILERIDCKLLQIEILPVASVSLDVDIQLNTSMNNISQEYHDFNDNLDNFPYNQLGKQILEDDTPELKIESGIVTLHTTPGIGFGLIFRSAPSKKGAVVCYIEPHGIADRSGVLQIGDRLLTVNGRPADKFERLEDVAKLSVVTTVQFDVEVHSFSDGPFSVTITRSEGSGFGITISGTGECCKGVVISHIKWGSVAHRSGRLFIGDQLLGINGTDIRGDLSTALEIFKQCGTTVTFIIKRTALDFGYSSPGLPSVDSAVESWGSSEIPSLQKDFRRQEFRDTWRTGTNESTNSFVSQHSDDETYSSLRLSESVLDAISAAQPNGLAKKPPSPPCPLQTNYRLRKVNLPTHWRGSSSINNTGLTSLEAEAITQPEVKSSPRTFRTFRGLSKEDENIQPQQNVPQTVFQVTLTKNMVFEDFGFSVSDGLYEKGVFINSIKPGSPADQSKMLKPYDKIIQVNDVPTHDLDCCLTVPLMASAGQTLTLTVVRYEDKNATNTAICWVEEVGEEAGEALERSETL